MLEDDSCARPVQTDHSPQEFWTTSKSEREPPDIGSTRLRRAGIHVLENVCHGTVFADECLNFSYVDAPGDVI
jgi:hypothetical protein